MTALEFELIWFHVYSRTYSAFRDYMWTPSTYPQHVNYIYSTKNYTLLFLSITICLSILLTVCVSVIIDDVIKCTVYQFLGTISFGGFLWGVGHGRTSEVTSVSTRERISVFFLSSKSRACLLYHTWCSGLTFHVWVAIALTKCEVWFW